MNAPRIGDTTQQSDTPTDGLEHIGSILRRWVLELMERAGVTEDEQLALFDERP